MVEILVMIYYDKIKIVVNTFFMVLDLSDLDMPSYFETR